MLCGSVFRPNSTPNRRMVRFTSVRHGYDCPIRVNRICYLPSVLIISETVLTRASAAYSPEQCCGYSIKASEKDSFSMV